MSVCMLLCLLAMLCEAFNWYQSKVASYCVRSLELLRLWRAAVKRARQELLHEF